MIDLYNVGNINIFRLIVYRIILYCVIVYRVCYELWDLCFCFFNKNV